jgi:hypothetical protein
MYALPDTDKNFYSPLSGFTEPWKINTLDFMNENSMYGLPPGETAKKTRPAAPK